MADAVISRIRGGQEAQRVVQALRQGTAPPGTLQSTLEALRGHNDQDLEFGFLREIEKALERGAAPA